jgi:hypothetical protein
MFSQLVIIIEFIANGVVNILTGSVSEIIKLGIGIIYFEVFKNTSL